MKLIIEELLAKLILVDLVMKFHVEHIILRTNGLLHVLCIKRKKIKLEKAEKSTNH